MAIPYDQKFYVGNDQRKIEVPAEVFLAFHDFMVGEKPAGELVIAFRNGGIAGVNGTKKVTYKGSGAKNT